MKITAILRKLGVFRTGSVSWQGDASERPIEAIMDDVYDREKDLVYFKDRTTGQRQHTAPDADQLTTVGKIDRKGRLIHYLSLGFGIFILFIMAAGGYFGPWFWGNAVAWLGFTRYTKKVVTQRPYAAGKMTGILLLLSLVSFFSLAAIPTDKARQPALSPPPPLDSLSRVDLALDLENDLHLEDVRVEVLDGGILEVRTKTPVKVSPGAIYGACAYIFGYLEPRLPKEIRHLRIILTVNGLDAMLLETARDNVVKRQAEEIDDTAFFKNLKTVNIGVGQAK